MTDMSVAEIVTSGLINGADPVAFVRAGAAMNGILRGTGALGARRLGVDEAGLWTDHLTWTTRAMAEAAAKTIFQRPEADAFPALIDPPGMKLRHGTIECSFLGEPDAPH